MKLITAIIKPFKLEDVRDVLAQFGIDSMTVRVAWMIARVRSGETGREAL
ncbi:hypothetical protein CCP4SC76_5470005 [Gammaproteobacteria bacterium]